MYTCKIFDEDGREVACEDVDGFAEVTVVMIKRAKDGKELVVDSFEPSEVDGHNDTLRYIGGRVVDFVEKS